MLVFYNTCKGAIGMKKILMTTLIIASISFVSCTNEPDKITHPDGETNSQVAQKYFSDVNDFPNEKGRALSDVEDGVYWQAANGFPLRNGEYFSGENIAYYVFNPDENRVEIAYMLYEGAMIQDETIEEDLYVNWAYDFKEEKVIDLIQENQRGETQNLIHFTDEEWTDYSEGHREFLERSLRHMKQEVE